MRRSRPRLVAWTLSRSLGTHEFMTLVTPLSIEALNAATVHDKDGTATSLANLFTGNKLSPVRATACDTSPRTVNEIAASEALHAALKQHNIKLLALGQGDYTALKAFGQ